MADLIPISPTSFAASAIGTLGFFLALVCWRPRIVTDYPRVWLSIVAIVSASALLLIVRFSPLGLRIDIDPSSGPLLPVSDPGQEVYAEAVKDFGSDDIYVVAMETDDIFTEENLKILDRVTESIRKIDGVRGAQSLTNVTDFRYNPKEDWVEVQPFIQTIPSDPAALAEIREQSVGDALYRKIMISGDGKTAAINITFKPMDDAEFVGRDLDGQIRAILDSETTDARHFYIAGRPHVRARAYHIMVRDLFALLPLAILVAAIVVYIITGSRRGTLLPLMNCLIGTLWTFGAMVVVGKDMNLITLVLGPTLVCVGSVYGVHVMSRYDAVAGEVDDPREAARQTLEYMRVPVLMAGFTTCVGFGALMLADVRATNELGAFCSLGILFVTLLSLTFLPAYLAILRLEPRSEDPSQGLYANRPRFATYLSDRVTDTLDGLGRLITRRANWFLLFWVGWTALMVAAIPRIVIDTDFLTFFNADSDVRTDFATVNQLLTGAVPIYVVFQGQGEGYFRDPLKFRQLQKIQEALEKQPGVRQVLSSVDLVLRGNRALGKNNPAEARVPDSREALAEVIFMLPKADTRRFQTSNHSAMNLVVRTGELGSRSVAALQTRIQGVIDEVGLPAGTAAGVTGNTILINKSADGIAGSQASTVGSAALTILLLICFWFRSVRVGVLALAPNIFPVLIFFGALGAGAAPLSVPTSLIGSITLGIAVDNTVHYVVSYLRRRQEGVDPNEAVLYGMHYVGRPIFVTSIMLMIGFSVITISGFATLRQFGYLASLTMGICMCTDLSLTPSLLVRFRP